MEHVKAKVSIAWFVRCPHCGEKYYVDAYQEGVVNCVCKMTFSYDNLDPEGAEEE